MPALAQLLPLLVAGGPGSGCNPAVARPRCGRPPGDTRAPAADRRVGELQRELAETEARLGGRLKKEVRYRLGIVRDGIQRELKQLQKPGARKLLPGLEKKKGKVTIHTEPPRSSAVRRQFISPREGFSYTELRPRGRRERSVRDPSRRHPLRGQFRELVESRWVRGRGVGTVFEARVVGGRQGEGVTVFVQRNLAERRVTIQEFSTGEYSWWKDAKEYKFRNIGRASGFLTKRYGIRLRLPKRGI